MNFINAAKWLTISITCLVCLIIVWETGIDYSSEIHFVPLSPTSVEAHFNFSHTGYIANIPLICAKSPSLQMVVVVISSPEHFQNRQDLRDTWTKPLSLSGNTSVVFFTGRSNEEAVNAEVFSEADRTRDMVIVDFDESYRNLSLKILLMLRWVKDYCPNAKFLLKADDDVFVNIYNLMKLINKKTVDNSAFYGQLGHNRPPIRDANSKWMVTIEEYAKPTYPDFVHGGSYLFGTKHISQLLSVCVKLPYLFLEDVFVTGICAEESQIPRKHHPGFCNPVFAPGGECRVLQLIIVHKVNGMMMQSLWAKVADMKMKGIEFEFNASDMF